MEKVRARADEVVEIKRLLSLLNPTITNSVNAHAFTMSISILSIILMLNW